MINNNQGSGSGKQGFLSDQDAANMEAIINEAKKDSKQWEFTKMKSENKEHIAELQKLSPAEILGGMKETLDNMKLIEYLFQDKQRAVRELEKEGMIDKVHIKKYRKDPDLLEQDTRRGLYFQFISLAVVGGVMQRPRTDRFPKERHRESSPFRRRYQKSVPPSSPQTKCTPLH